MTEAPHTAVFLARAWWEDGQFRARVSYIVDIESDDVDQYRIVTADPAEVRRHLANWLDEAATAADLAAVTATPACRASASTACGSSSSDSRTRTE